MTIQEIKKKIIPDLKKQGVIRAVVFDPVARNGYGKTSDINILVDFQDKKSLLDIIRLQFVLGKKLGKKVDLLTYKSIHPLLKDIILKDQKIIYEKPEPSSKIFSIKEETWEEVIDFTKIKKGGVNIEELL